MEVEPALCLRVHLTSFQPLFALCVTIELAPLSHACPVSKIQKMQEVVSVTVESGVSIFPLVDNCQFESLEQCLPPLTLIELHINVKDYKQGRIKPFLLFKLLDIRIPENVGNYVRQRYLTEM